MIRLAFNKFDHLWEQIDEYSEMLFVEMVLLRILSHFKNRFNPNDPSHP